MTLNGYTNNKRLCTFLGNFQLLILSHKRQDLILFAGKSPAELWQSLKIKFFNLVKRSIAAQISFNKAGFLIAEKDLELRGGGEIPLSLDAKVYKGIDGMCSLLELLDDERDFTREIEEKIIAKEAMKFLEKNLNESDYKVYLLHLRFLGQTEIAKITGLSQSWVSRSIKRTNWLLRTKFRKEIEK